MIVQRPGQKLIFIPSSDIAGIYAYAPAAGAAGGWWDNAGAIASCVGAWQAKGAADYATSLVDLSGNSNDLSEGNGAVPWASGTGWTFTAASAQYFDTGLVPANDQSTSMLMQFTGINAIAGGCGMADTGSRLYLLSPNYSNGNSIYQNGGSVQVAGGYAAGNIGISGNQGYKDGAANGGAIPAWSDATSYSIYIGARNDRGSAGLYLTGNIESVALYNATLNAGEVSAVAALMAAL